MNHKKYLIPTSILLTFYYLIPLTKTQGLVIISLLIIYPLVNFILSLIQAKKHGFDLMIPILSGLLFLPTVYIYYNESALFYVLAYATISLFGSGIGAIVKNNRKRS